MHSVVSKRRLGVPLDMSRIAPEYTGSDLSDHSITADVLLREEPDDEEEEDEDDGGDKEEDDDDDGERDEGYSE
jgi:hypothetical protein